MKKVVLNAIAAALVVLGLGSVAMVSPAHAADTTKSWSECANGSVECLTDAGGDTGVFSNDDMMGTLTVIINVIVGLVGFISVVMIVIGGISFATSQGDTAKTTKARNTILYGVVGLVVALLAFAVVNFVLTNVFSS